MGLVVADRPARWQLDPPEQRGEAFQHDGWTVAVGDDVVEFVPGDLGEPRVCIRIGPDL